MYEEDICPVCEGHLSCMRRAPVLYEEGIGRIDCDQSARRNVEERTQRTDGAQELQCA